MLTGPLADDIVTRCAILGEYARRRVRAALFAPSILAPSKAPYERIATRVL